MQVPLNCLALAYSDLNVVVVRVSVNLGPSIVYDATIGNQEQL